MSDLLQDFFNEADEQLEALFKDIAELRERYAEGRARRALVARIFRQVHTLKGTSSVAELTEVSSLAHEMETLLESVRAGQVTVLPEIIDLIDDSANALSILILASGKHDHEVVPGEILGRLRRAAAGDSAKSSVDGEILMSSLPADISS